MDDVRAITARQPARHHDPQDELFGWMVILGASIGVDIAVVDQAFRYGDQGWGIFFTAMAIALLAAYLWCAVDWATALFD